MQLLLIIYLLVFIHLLFVLTILFHNFYPPLQTLYILFGVTKLLFHAVTLRASVWGWNWASCLGHGLTVLVHQVLVICSLEVFCSPHHGMEGLQTGFLSLYVILSYYWHCERCKLAWMEKSPLLSQHRSGWYCPLGRYNTFKAENTFLIEQVMNFLQATRWNLAPGGLMQYGHAAMWDLLSKNLHKLLVSWQLLFQLPFDYVSPHPFAALPRLTAGEGLGWASPCCDVFLQQRVAALSSTLKWWCLGVAP